MVKPSQNKSLETIAVYWEHRVKTYGFQTLEELSLIEVTLPLIRIADLGLAVQKIDLPEAGFHLTLIEQSGGHMCWFYLLTAQELEHAISRHITELISQGAGESVSLKSPVDLIFFQGPHYGDRYGIAEAAFGALKTCGMPILLAACSQSCIYIVIPCGKAKETASLLAQVFEVPKKIRSRKVSSKSKR
ncbi:MAG: hypothetical protein DRH10_02220 [Deltaproteobacteria bacterium]|nr:MAG: hypothetical protein DRH10_02220 [Deltaproteobacteria bacterium]